MTDIIPYNDSFCEALIKHAEKGGSIIAFRGKKRIPQSIWDSWLTNYVSFKDSVDLAKCLNYAFWEQIVLDNLTQTAQRNGFMDEDNMTKQLSSKDKLTMAYNMMKQLDNQNYKTKGVSMMIGDTKIEEVQDLTEYGSTDTYEDIYKKDTDSDGFA